MDSLIRKQESLADLSFPKGKDVGKVSFFSSGGIFSNQSPFIASGQGELADEGLERENYIPLE